MSDAFTGQTLRLASFNIQAGIGTRRMRHMLTYSFRYVLPHRQVVSNLERIAQQMRNFDIVGLQEADCGSFRSRQIKQAQYIAERAYFPYCHSQVTRDVGAIASIGLGLMSRFPCTYLKRHKLPASRHGRGLMEAVFQIENCDLAIFVTHLSLKQSSRSRQLRYIARQLKQHKNAILMGDMNCDPDSDEFHLLLADADMHIPMAAPPTFPSWQPQRRIDHILGRGKARVVKLEVIPFIGSDHLPISAEIEWANTQE
ncbi:MAG: endonuclease/exonuclease/phosphatase family protein [Mariprofundaceae bacterium]